MELTSASPPVFNMQPEGSLPAASAGATPPSGFSRSGYSSANNYGVSATSPKAGLPATRKHAINEPNTWGIKKASSILLELEAGKREAEERNALNSKLFELGTELSKVRCGFYNFSFQCPTMWTVPFTESDRSRHS